MRILIPAFLLLSAAMAGAEPRQHGNLIYDLPDNWYLGHNSAGIRTLVYDGDDEICQFCYIYLSAGVQKSGDLAAFVEEKAPLFVDEEDRDDITVLQPPSVSTIGPMSIALYGLKVDSNIVIYMGFELPDRFELVAFDGYAYDEEELTKSLAVFENEVQPLFLSLQFVSMGAQPLLPEPEPGPLSGVYWGWHNETSLGLDGMMRVEIDHRLLVFWEDGYFFNGEPPEGTKPLDRDALMEVANDDFGTYTVSGDTLSLIFADGVKEELSADGDAWNDGDASLYQVTPLADGTTIDGSISSFFYTGFTPGTGLEGGMSASSLTEFKPDGTYTGSSFSGASANFVNGVGDLTGGFTTGNEESQGGRYEIRDGLLIQYPDDGSPPRSKIAFDAGDGMILIGEQFLETE
ncbi:hypothetical protein [Tabrizicola sp.]|uniref:hypothetical protein n=1 Tax=Tabrizicola sp. TaxID=2005166 RepID=UPI003F350335